MANPVIYQEVTFLPDASTQHSFAYLPRSCNGQYAEYTVYIMASAGVSAGAVQIQTSFPPPASGQTQILDPPPPLYTGTWANTGSPITASSASTQTYGSVSGSFADVRLDISTAISGGTVRAFVVANLRGA